MSDSRRYNQSRFGIRPQLLSKAVKIYQLEAEPEADWHAPSQVAEILGAEFSGVQVDAAAAALLGERYIARYKQLIDAGLGDKSSTPVDEVERSWDGALSLAVQVDPGAAGYLLTIARKNTLLELEFSSEVPRRRHRSLAVRAATALGYHLVSIEGD